MKMECEITASAVDIVKAHDELEQAGSVEPFDYIKAHAIPDSTVSHDDFAVIEKHYITSAKDALMAKAPKPSVTHDKDSAGKINYTTATGLAKIKKNINKSRKLVQVIAAECKTDQQRNLFLRQAQREAIRLTEYISDLRLEFKVAITTDAENKQASASL